MISIAHDRDVDGLACHAILHRHCVSKGLEIRHLFVDYSDLCEKLQRIGDARGEEIVIADLGFSDAISGCQPLLEELAKTNELKWYDHHDWTGVKLSGAIELVLDAEGCAAELVADAYMPEDEVSSRIAELARAQDFMGEDKLAWELYDVISAGFDKTKLVELLSRGVFWNDELEACHSKYQELKVKAFTYLDEHSKYYRLGDWTCLMGFSTNGLSSTIATGHLLEKNADFAICAWPSGKMSFRRNNQEIDLKKIAALFGGGGRAAAAGGQYERSISEENYLRAFEDIMERISLGYLGSGEFRP